VPARSGSKGVPGKNILRFGSQTALSLRVTSIRNSGVAGDIVCSTDSAEYADIARSAGARAPFLRPALVASDTASTSDVIRHALDWLRDNEGRTYDDIVIAEPSSPFVRPDDIIRGCRLLSIAGVDAVVSVKPAPVSSRFLARMSEDGNFEDFLTRLTSGDVRRQAQESEFTPNGCFYASRVENFLRAGTLYAGKLFAFEMDEMHSVEIDSPLDARFAQFLWQTGAVDASLWDAKT